MKINLDTHISVPETVYTQEVDDETVLLDFASRKYFSTCMRQLMCQYGALRTAYETMLAEYEVAPERLKADLINLTKNDRKGTGRNISGNEIRA